MSTSKKAKAPKATKTAQKSSSEPHHPIAKRYIFMALGVVVVMSLIFIWYSATQTQETLDETENLPTHEELSEKDTDGDGIEDWRELLMGTNPLAYDTNNDGVGDDVIIQATETVLAAGELNRLREQYPDATDEELLTISRASENPANLTVTERLSRDLYVASEVLDKMGLLTDELRNDISQEFIDELIFEYQYPLRISTDFDINSGATPQERVTYLETVFDYVNNRTYLEPDTLLIFENSLETENQELLEKALEPQLIRLFTLVQNLETISVPTRFINQHEALVNALVRITLDIGDIQRFYDDPMRGYAAALRFSPNMTNYEQALNEFTAAANAYLDEEIAKLNTPNL